MTSLSVKAFVSTAFALLVPTLLHAQDSAYQPSFTLPEGPQLVALYIGSSDCGACQRPELKAALETMKSGLQKRAVASGSSFAVIGVALDWSPTEGFGFLQGSGAFDEMWTGGNWANMGALRYIWTDTTATPGMPQVIVLRRTIGVGAKRLSVTPERILVRLVGDSEIEAWVRRGLPLDGPE